MHWESRSSVSCGHTTGPALKGRGTLFSSAAAAAPDLNCTEHGYEHSKSLQEACHQAAGTKLSWLFCLSCVIL